jgi:hypothetical protein
LLSAGGYCNICQYGTIQLINIDDEDGGGARAKRPRTDLPDQDLIGMDDGALAGLVPIYNDYDESVTFQLVEADEDVYQLPEQPVRQLFLHQLCMRVRGAKGEWQKPSWAYFGQSKKVPSYKC